MIESHIGIEGSSAADAIAKAALSRKMSKTPVYESTKRLIDKIKFSYTIFLADINF
jgi:predicted protein tyrosine phosphatase